MSLRDETDDDLPFLRALYASTRAAELARTGWDEAARRAFTDSQFALQRTQYRDHYAHGEWLVIERAGAPVGRLYLDASYGEARLVDIALLPDARGAGLGTVLMRAWLAWADGLALLQTLYVEPFNPAYRLYRRMGFAYSRSVGVYHLLQRAPGTAELAGADILSRWPS